MPPNPLQLKPRCFSSPALPTVQLQLVSIKGEGLGCDLVPMAWWLPATQSVSLVPFPRMSFQLRLPGLLPKGATLLSAL